MNLKEILKNPGVWDPFILSYVEVRTYSQHPDVTSEIYILILQDETELIGNNLNNRLIACHFIKKKCQNFTALE